MPYVCPFCDKGTKSVRGLESHLTTHSDLEVTE